jgi:hypothetical protein
MVVAKIYPHPEAGGRGKKGMGSIHFPQVPKQTLSNARTVIAHAADLVGGVIAPISVL